MLPKNTRVILKQGLVHSIVALDLWEQPNKVITKLVNHNHREMKTRTMKCQATNAIKAMVKLHRGMEQVVAVL